MEVAGNELSGWEQSNIQAFWGEIAPCDHLVQIYENDRTFLATLEGFAGDGFIKGESVVIIATSAHLKELEIRLLSHGFNMEHLKKTDQYIALDAQESLDTFMVDNWPDEDLFIDFVAGIMLRAQAGKRRVRAFGEMVALLWAQGNNGATVHLENLWCRLHDKSKFCLYCAYPQSGFTQDPLTSIDKICMTHTKVIDGNSRPSTEIYYRQQA